MAVRTASGRLVAAVAAALCLAILRPAFCGARAAEGRRPARGPARTPPSSTALSAVLSATEAYQELGLDVGADTAEVRKAFRRLARKFHPDVLTPQEFASAGARFVAIKRAYDFILGNPGGLAAAAVPKDIGQEMSGFAQKMAMGRGHHKISDGRNYDLWLDLRGVDWQLTSSKEEVLKLFWRTRSIVDGLGISLLKEGSISAIVVSEPAECEDEELRGALEKAEEQWDYAWMPLLFATRADGRLRYGKTGAPAGWVRPVTSGRIGSQEEEDRWEEEEDLVISAGDAREADFAQARYRFVMRSMLIPPDPAAWATVAAEKVDVEVIIEAAAMVRE